MPKEIRATSDHTNPSVEEPLECQLMPIQQHLKQEKRNCRCWKLIQKQNAGTTQRGEQRLWRQKIC